MKGAFPLDKASSSREHARCKLVDVVMISRFDAHSFCHLSYLIGQIWVQLYKNVKYKPEDWNDLASAMSEVRRQCEKLDLEVTLNQIKRIEEDVAQQVDPPVVERHLQELQNRIFDELAAQLIFFVEPHKRRYYEKQQFPPEVIAAFPSAAYDMEEAGKCYALGQNTACVFHLMRVLEVALNGLAKKLRVPFEYRNWHNIINDIQKTIATIGPDSGPYWKEEKHYYSEGAIQFRHFKDAWRNYVMHAHDQYDEKRALQIFNSVCEFMSHLSIKCSERGSSR
jgi:hypothetical protein